MMMNGQVRPLAPPEKIGINCGEQEKEWNGMMAAEPTSEYGKK